MREFAELLTKKKAAYPDYRKARNEMQELMKAQKNVEDVFCRGKNDSQKEPKHGKRNPPGFLRFLGGFLADFL